jgi:hypothetical protein
MFSPAGPNRTKEHTNQRKNRAVRTAGLGEAGRFAFEPRGLCRVHRCVFAMSECSRISPSPVTAVTDSPLRARANVGLLAEKSASLPFQKGYPPTPLTLFSLVEHALRKLHKTKLFPQISSTVMFTPSKHTNFAPVFALSSAAPRVPTDATHQGASADADTGSARSVCSAPSNPP